MELTLLDENNKQTSAVVDVFAPYEIFHHLHEAGQFQDSLMSLEVPLDRYWETLLAHPDFSQHPLKDKPHLWPTTVPVSYFTDGAEFSKSSSAEGFRNLIKHHSLNDEARLEGPGFRFQLLSGARPSTGGEVSITTWSRPSRRSPSFSPRRAS